MIRDKFAPGNSLLGVNLHMQTGVTGGLHCAGVRLLVGFCANRHIALFLTSLWIYTMNRCLASPLRALYPTAKALTLTSLLLAVPAAWAEQPDRFDDLVDMTPQIVPRHFPPTADKGHMRFVSPNEVTLDGVHLRVSPGTRIKDRLNRMVMAAQLQGQAFNVMYTRDAMQQIGDIWILSNYEMNQPSPKQRRDQILRMNGVDPTRPYGTLSDPQDNSIYTK